MDEKILKWLYDIKVAIDNITDETIWAIIVNHLPKLKIKVENLLQSAKKS